MLKPSGGFFKKLFNPDRMAKAKKRETPAVAKSNTPNKGGKSLFGRPMRKEY